MGLRAVNVSSSNGFLIVMVSKVSIVVFFLVKMKLMRATLGTGKAKDMDEPVVLTVSGETVLRVRDSESTKPSKKSRSIEGESNYG